MSARIETPIYSKIALDMAGRIYKGEFREGDKIHGRSTLAGEYNVSPETIRRAMILLEDVEIIKVNHGSGIFVKSRENAGKYIESFENKDHIRTLKTEMKKLMDQKHKIEDEITNITGQIVDYADRLKNTNPIYPVEIEIKPQCHLVGKMIAETKFWQKTGATIIGISRKGSIILSPGPYAVFESGDFLLVVGDQGVLERTTKYVNET